MLVSVYCVQCNEQVCESVLILCKLCGQMRRNFCRFSDDLGLFCRNRRCGVSAVPTSTRPVPVWTWCGAGPTTGRRQTGVGVCFTVTRMSVAPDTEPEVWCLFYCLLLLSLLHTWQCYQTLWRSLLPYGQCWSCRGLGVQPPNAHFWAKIGFKFESLGKISNISTSDPQLF